MIFASRWATAMGATLAGLTLAAAPVRSQTELMGPLRIRDLTPFNVLRLDMLPADTGPASPGSWNIEAAVSYANTFVMSDNVRYENTPDLGLSLILGWTK